MTKITCLRILSNNLISKNICIYQKISLGIFLALFWAITFYIFYIFCNKNPNFISNDSYQYLSIAHDIFLDKKSTGLIRYALDLYYDEIATFGYDLNNLKPYHFPSYSAFLSLFYYIYENHIFVVFFSQFIAYLIFSMSAILILRQYCRLKTAIIITLTSIFSTPIIFYIGDSGKEILCSALSLMAFYLALYSPNKDKFYNLAILSIILTFLSITRNFYLLLSAIIVFYRLIPTKYKNDASPSEKAPNKTHGILLTLLIFIIPFVAYIYCYYFIEIHLFIFDNRTAIYGGKNLEDLSIRILTNLFLGILMFFIQYFGMFIDEEFPKIAPSYNLITVFGLTLIGILLYLKISWRSFRENGHYKLSKILLFNLFNLAILTSVILKFNLLGYRLTIAYIPFLYLFIYQNYYKNAKHYAKFIIITLLILNLIMGIKVLDRINMVNSDFYLLDEKLLSIVKKHQSKNIVIGTIKGKRFCLPLFYKYPHNVYIFSSWREENLCEDLKNYHYHNIDFDLIFARDQFYKTCNFARKNFDIIYDEELDSYMVSKKLPQVIK